MREKQVPTRSEIRNFLSTMIENVPDSENFLELSREREMNYAMKSVDRWWEILNLYVRTGRSFQGKTVLDIGTSPFSFYLNELFDYVSTLDLTPHLCSRSKRYGMTFYEGGLLMNDIPNNTFDVIFCLEVIEHLHLDTILIFKELKNKMRSGGLLILSTPNLACLSNRILLALNKKMNHFTYPPYSENPHIIHGHRHDRIFMPPELKEYAYEAGFGNVALKYHLYFPPMSNVKFFNPRSVLSLLLRFTVPSFRQYVILLGTKD